MKYGPFTPQECDKVAGWLQKQNIEFTMTKDEEKERAFRASTGDNLIRRAEFRTETYLAQLFYIEVEWMTPLQAEEFGKLFLSQPEQAPTSLKPPAEETEFMLRLDARKTTRTRRFWAAVLIFIWFAALFGPYLFDKKNLLSLFE